mgnify:CR=1 FL=1
MTGQEATMMHTKRWQKGVSTMTAPCAGRRLCLSRSLLPVDSRRVMRQPTDSDPSADSYKSTTLPPFGRYRMSRP